MRAARAEASAKRKAERSAEQRQRDLISEARRLALEAVKESIRARIALRASPLAMRMAPSISYIAVSTSGPRGSDRFWVGGPQATIPEAMRLG